ncbi:glycosyltransferase WbsX family protein [Trichloromonas sp.]|uniref:glycosyltransferase WbsX family protein n=1 Tax=Trichloromonas sp. TaxID=3069249 RepID=UPI002A3A5050|nr:glycoside hydrolase family 99-like domain-containing protein [Trichloromonas sp.]
MKQIKPIAIVLPQFHPIPENNLWWGEGFTEWTNVVKGRPRFRGHYQPHLPKDLGYYDLRLPEIREAQAQLAKRYGIYGFCYYHYWFGGRRILEKPVDMMIASGRPDFPFMLCWANENWSRNWDGGFRDILIEQTYSREDFVAHARHLVNIFEDRRYIRVDGRPVFAIYKDGNIEDLDAGLDVFRYELKRHGIDVYLLRFERRVGTRTDFAKAFAVFDAGAEFQPLSRQLAMLDPSWKRIALFSRLKPLRLGSRLFSNRDVGVIYRYQDIVENDLNYNFQQGWPIYPGVSPGWDNSPRRVGRRALVIDGSTPELFKRWVVGKLRKTVWDGLPEKFLFINAWNEWAEGCHLEPCERWGTQFLQALQQGIEDACDNCNDTNC